MFSDYSCALLEPQNSSAVDCDLEAVVQSVLHPVPQKCVIITVPLFIVHDCMGASSFNLYLSTMDI